LADAGASHSGGDGGQLAFSFVAQAVAAEGAAQRIAWETRLLGLPVSLHPVEAVSARPPSQLTLAQLANTRGASVSVAGTRLPGWTGGKGWFLADAEHYVIAMPPKGMTNPKPWRAIEVRGRWCNDEWGDCWLAIDEWKGL
jgi:hypothetical protein